MMAHIVARGFSGIRPKITPRLLRDGEGVTADNCRLFSGALQSWKRPKIVAAPSKSASGTVRSIFRMNDGTTDYWLNWLTDVRVVRGAVAGDTTQRIYWTGDGEPRRSNLARATQSGSDYPVAFHVLGVFPPSTAPTVGHTGGVAASETRAYVYTHVTQDGEESAPSPAGSHTGPSDATWNITGMDLAPANSFTPTGASWASGTATVTVASTRGLRVGEEVAVTGITPSGYNAAKVTLTAVAAGSVSYAVASNPGAFSSATANGLTRIAPHNTTNLKTRLYRVLTATSGGEYQFVAEFTTTATYNDTVASTALGAPIESTEYEMPPTDMKGLVEMANGMMAAFSKNDVCFCEPFKPHAWPSRYRQTVPRDIQDIGAYDQTVVVGTKGEPYAGVGAHPESITMERVQGIKEPCLSTRGMANLNIGVAYPGPNGLVLVGVGGAAIATEQVLSKKEFETFYPSTLLAVGHQGRYFAWYDAGDSAGDGFVFDRSGVGPSLARLKHYFVTGAWEDRESGDLYIVHENIIKKFDADPVNQMPYDWASKVYAGARPTNMAVARASADFDALSDPDGEAAAAAENVAANTIVLAGSESYPGRSVIRGEWAASMYTDYWWAGSELVGGNYTDWDPPYLTLQLFADAEETGSLSLVHSEDVTDGRPFRLPKGYKSRDYQVRVSGSIDCFAVEVATSVQELAKI